MTIVIPNYNGMAHLKDCLDSLRIQSFCDFRILIVDNASSDSSIEFIESVYPECQLIKLEKNLGFAKAVNVGIRNAISINSSKYIILLNNDIECDKDFVKELMNGFKDPDTGSVASKMMNYYDRNIIDDTGNFIKLDNLPYPRGQKEVDTGQYDKGEWIFGACAGAAIYKSEIFDKVGYFDEDFISYFEDVDISFRQQRYGYKCYYNPKAVCYHKRGATSLKNIPYCRYLIEKNLIALRIKNYPASIIKKNFFKYIKFVYISFYRDLRWFSPKTAMYSVMGHLKGSFDILKSLKKRKLIFKNTVVSEDYLIRICNENNTEEI